MTAAEILWKAAVLVFETALIAGIVYDLFLSWTDRETVSDFLRDNPGWFWWPAAGVVGSPALRCIASVARGVVVVRSAEQMLGKPLELELADPEGHGIIRLTPHLTI